MVRSGCGTVGGAIWGGCAGCKGANGLSLGKFPSSKEKSARVVGARSTCMLLMAVVKATICCCRVAKASS